MNQGETLRKEDGIDLQALLDGDHREFEKLVRQESRRLFRVIMRFVKDEDAALGVMQETFLQAYQRLGTFRGESKLTTWLYAIGINQARSYLRKNRRYDTREEQDIERLQPSFRLGMYTESYEPWAPDAVTSREERKRLVREAIAQLPENYRVVVELRDIEELSTDEVAQMLELTSGAVRVRLHRGRQALRALLDPYFGSRK